MITDALLVLLNWIITGFMALRPAWEPTIPASVGSVVRMMMGLNELLPVNEIMLCLAMLGAGITAFVTWKWVVKLIDWVADVIP